MRVFRQVHPHLLSIIIADRLTVVITGDGERDILLVCNSGEVQLGTKERAEVPELHAGLPVQAQAPLDLVTYA